MKEYEEIERLKLELARSDRAREELWQQNNHRGAEIERLKAELANSNTSRDKLYDLARQRGVEVDRMTERLDKFGVDIMQIEEQLSERDTEIERLKAELVRCDRDRETLFQQNRSRCEENARLRTELAEQMNTAESSVVRFRAAQEALRSRAEAAEAEVARLKTEREKRTPLRWLPSCEHLAKAVKSGDEQLAKLAERIDDLDMRHESLDRLQAALAERIDALAKLLAGEKP